MPELKSGNGVTIRPVGNNLFLDGFQPISSEFSVFVSKAGNDSNDGLSVSNPKLTISAAMTAAQLLLDDGATNVRVDIGGAGLYSESFEVPGAVILTGFAATVEGQIILNTGSRVIIYAHYASANNQIMALKEGASGGWYTTFLSDGRGRDGLLTGVTNCKSETNSSIFFVDAALVFVTEGGKGLEDSASGFGHMHFNVKDLYLAGNNAEGLRFVGGQSDGIGFFDHILEIGTPTGTVGIRVGNNSIAKVTGCEIRADVAWNVAGNGDLYFNEPRIVGTKTGVVTNGY